MKGSIQTYLNMKYKIFNKIFVYELLFSDVSWGLIVITIMIFYGIAYVELILLPKGFT